MKQTYLLTFFIEFYELLSVLKETKYGEIPKQRLFPCQF